MDVVTLSRIYHLFYFGRSARLPFSVSAKNTITGCLQKWTRPAFGPGSDFRVFIVVSTNSNIRYIVLRVGYYIAYFMISCIEISTLLSIMVCKFFSDKTNSRIGSLNLKKIVTVIFLYPNLVLFAIFFGYHTPI